MPQQLAYHLVDKLGLGQPYGQESSFDGADHRGLGEIPAVAFITCGIDLQTASTSKLMSCGADAQRLVCCAAGRHSLAGVGKKKASVDDWTAMRSLGPAGQYGFRSEQQVAGGVGHGWIVQPTPTHLGAILEHPRLASASTPHYFAAPGRGPSTPSGTRPARQNACNLPAIGQVRAWH